MLRTPTSSPWALCFFVFSLEFRTLYLDYALQSVFINPYFMRLGCSSLHVAFIWLVPVYGLFGIYPASNKAFEANRMKCLVYSLCGVMVAGIGIFVFSGGIAEWYFGESVEKGWKVRSVAVAAGLLGFALMGVSHSGLCCLLSQVTQSQLLLGSGCLGRIGGFFVASCNIFEKYSLYLYYAVGDNMTFSYLLSGVFFLLGAFAGVPSIPEFKEPLGNPLKSLKLFKRAPKKIWVLSAGYFFCIGSNVLISLYASSWVTFSLLGTSSLSFDRHVFDVGVSWGAFSLLLMGIITLTSILLIYKLKEDKLIPSSYFLGISNLLCSVLLVPTFFVEDFRSVFVLIPLCGFAIGSNCVLPYELMNSFKNSDKSTPWNHLLQVSLFFAQMLVLGVFPCALLMWPEQDDNKFGLLTAGISSFIGSLFCFFL